MTSKAYQNRSSAFLDSLISFQLISLLSNSKPDDPLQAKARHCNQQRKNADDKSSLEFFQRQHLEKFLLWRFEPEHFFF